MLLEPETPLYAVGTSLGANILVKYLGEDGVNVPLVGAVAISNPWDLLIGDRFFTRAVMQRFYDRVLGNSLKGAGKLHKETYVRLSDWEGIEKVGGGKDQYTDEDMDHIREEWAGYVTNLIFR